MIMTDAGTKRMVLSDAALTLQGQLIKQLDSVIGHHQLTDQPVRLFSMCCRTITVC